MTIYNDDILWKRDASLPAAWKLSFPCRNEIFPMAGGDLGKIIRELTLVLYHIEEGLRLALLATQDISCVNPLLEAANLIQVFLRMTSIRVSNDHLGSYGDEAEYGFNPLNSQFGEITGMHKLNNELCCGSFQNLKRTKVFCNTVTPPRRPSSHGVAFECLWCDSRTQQKQLINEHQHRGMYAGEDPLQRTKSI